MDRITDNNKETERLLAIFSDLDENELAVASGLIEQAAFLSGVLAELQNAINQNGMIDEYQNGEHQRGLKESATLKAYNQTAKTYTTIINRLLKIVPRTPRKTESPQERWAKINAEKERERLAFIERINARRENPAKN